jgi:hypothetical protein
MVLELLPKMFQELQNEFAIDISIRMEAEIKGYEVAFR